MVESIPDSILFDSYLSGQLKLTFNLLSKFALPPKVVSSHLLTRKKSTEGKRGRGFLYQQDLCFLEFDSPLFADVHKK